MKIFSKTTIILAILIILSVTLNVIQFINMRSGNVEKLDYADNNISVYLKTNTSESSIITLKSIIEKQEGVQSVLYVSSVEALVNFKIKHANDKLTLQSLNELGVNPFGAILNVTVSDSSQKQSISDFIEKNDKNSIIEKVQY